MSSLQVEYVVDFQMRVAQPTGPAWSTSIPVLSADFCGVPWFALAGAPSRTSDELDWDSVHEAIQEGLERLTGLVLDQSRETVWKSGRSSARAFPLLSYRVFYRSDGDDYDPVIVSVTVTLEGSIARVSGDISGDESGRVYFDEGCHLDVPSCQDAIFKGASLVASRLAAQVQIVLDAISDRDFQVVER